VNPSIEEVAAAIDAAQMPRCEGGHDGITLDAETGRPDCPVPEHTPKRIVDLADASIVWEADDAPTDSNTRPTGEVVDA